MNRATPWLVPPLFGAFAVDASAAAEGRSPIVRVDGGAVADRGGGFGAGDRSLSATMATCSTSCARQLDPNGGSATTGPAVTKRRRAYRRFATTLPQ